MSTKNELPVPNGHGDTNGELLKIEQVAAHYQICTKSVRRHIKRLDIPILRVGNQIRIQARFLPLFATKQWGGK